MLAWLDFVVGDAETMAKPGKEVCLNSALLFSDASKNYTLSTRSVRCNGSCYALHVGVYAL